MIEQITYLLFIRRLDDQQTLADNRAGLTADRSIPRTRFVTHHAWRLTGAMRTEWRRASPDVD